MEKKISKNQKMYPHHFGCSQNHPKAPKKTIFGGLTKGIMIIWGHFVILVVCKLIIFIPQALLSVEVNFT